MSTKLERTRIPKRFYFLTLLVYAPVFAGLTLVGARWYGYALAVASFVGLLAFRGSRFFHGWRIPACFLLAYFTAFGGLSAARPRWDVSLAGQIGGGAVRLFTHLAASPAAQTPDAGVWTPPEGYTFCMEPLPLCSMEALVPQTGDNGYAVLQLHGGAFVSGLNDLYRRMAVRYSQMLGGAAVYTPDYRLWPEAAYPAQQTDAMNAWRLLTQTYPPDHIVVVGDSAGGNLALSLTLRLRDAGEGLPMAIVALSPWADLSNSGPSHVYNALRDPTFGLTEAEWDGKTPVGVPSTYADGLDATQPYLSPSYGDYRGFPPMLLQAGAEEVLLSDSERVAENAVAQGVDCTLTVYAGMFHVFQGSLDLLPESREAWQQIEAFLHEHMTQ